VTNQTERPVRSGAAAPADYKALYRKLETTIDQIERMKDTSMLLSACLESLLRDFKDDLGFVGGRIYKRQGDSYVLKVRQGPSDRPPLGYRVPLTYVVIQRVMREGLVVMTQADADFDKAIEGEIGVSSFAAFIVDDEHRHIVSLSIEGPIDEEHTLYALNGVRHIVNMKIRQERLLDIILQACDIQMSLLPVSPPEFEGYDMWGSSRPADTVGGDLFDYIPQSSRIMGLAVADASGHGLPAALQARDVIIGMRMGIQENLKIVAAIERLNRVINRSSLTSRFVSLFYGEIESNGNFIYCNAGHPPALLYRGGSVTLLTYGGAVLGPNPTARYERGFATVGPGDYVLMYTDGVTEALGPGDEEFGVERIEAILRKRAGENPRTMVEAVFEAVDRFCGSLPQTDDRTILVLRRV